ncbi:MAG: hypothetical protein QF768_08040, partial [Candidatus Latescibacteria bacterium]|nr:hypothetical protein [Candidatus Latescibacterota bacterium]
MNTPISISERSDFLESAPLVVEELLRARFTGDETQHVRIAADMMETRRYGERWLIVSDKRVL